MTEKFNSTLSVEEKLKSFQQDMQQVHDLAMSGLSASPTSIWENLPESSILLPESAKNSDQEINDALVMAHVAILKKHYGLASAIMYFTHDKLAILEKEAHASHH